jgi:hypothetical protein
MKKIISKSALFTGVLLASLVIFGLFTNVVKAEYYSNNYPYLGGYGNYTYTNNYSVTPNYTTNGLNYSSTYYGQSCPTGFNLGLQSGIYVCYKFLNNNYNYSNYNTGYNNSSYGLVSGCLPGYVYSPTTGQRCDVYNNYDDDNYNNYDGEISNYDVRSGSDTDLEEGDRNREIIKIRFDVEDGDIRLDRIKFNFEFAGDNGAVDLPWDTFDEVRLLLDGDEIDSIETDNRNDWDNEGSDNDNYSLTFKDLNEKIRDNDRADITLEVDVNSSISGANNDGISWNIFVPDRGLRAYGDNGDTIYAGDDREDVSININ